MWETFVTLLFVFQFGVITCPRMRIAEGLSLAIEHEGMLPCRENKENKEEDLQETEGLKGSVDVYMQDLLTHATLEVTLVRHWDNIVVIFDEPPGTFSETCLRYLIQGLNQDWRKIWLYDTQAFLTSDPWLYHSEDFVSGPYNIIALLRDTSAQTVVERLLLLRPFLHIKTSWLLVGEKPRNMTLVPPANARVTMLVPRVCSNSSVKHNFVTIHDVTMVAGRPLVDQSGSFDLQEGLILPNKHDSTYFPGFGGRMFRITTLEYEPFHFKVYNKTAMKWEYTGLCFDIFKELAALLNFTYTIKEPGDNQFGGLLDNGSWTGLVGLLVTREVDLAVAELTITAERMEAVDFMTPFYEESMSYVIERPLEDKSRTYLLPFKSGVWMCVLASIPLAGFICWALSTFSPREHCGLVRLSNAMHSAFGAFCGQGCVWLPRYGSTRVFICFWRLFILIIAATYTGNLIAFLSVSKVSLPLRTLDNLVGNDDYTAFLTRGVALQQVIMTSPPGTSYRRLWDKIQGTAGSLGEREALLARVLTEPRSAFIDETTAIEFLVARDCHYVRTPARFFKANLGFAAQKGFPYMSVFNKKIQQILESGLVDQWKKKYWPKGESCAKEGVKLRHQASLADTQGAFFLLGLGLGLAVLGMVVEWLFSGLLRVWWQKLTLPRLPFDFNYS